MKPIIRILCLQLQCLSAACLRLHGKGFPGGRHQYDLEIDTILTNDYLTIAETVKDWQARQV